MGLLNNGNSRTSWIESFCLEESDADVPSFFSFLALFLIASELMNRSVTANTKRKGLIEIVCAASEFVDVVPIRFGEEEVLKRLAVELSVRLGKDADVNDPHVKALLLLYVSLNCLK